MNIVWIYIVYCFRSLEKVQRDKRMDKWWNIRLATPLAATLPYHSLYFLCLIFAQQHFFLHKTSPFTSWKFFCLCEKGQELFFFSFTAASNHNFLSKMVQAGCDALFLLVGFTSIKCIQRQFIYLASVAAALLKVQLKSTETSSSNKPGSTWVLVVQCVHSI